MGVYKVIWVSIRNLEHGLHLLLKDTSQRLLSWFRLLCYIILKAYDKSHSKEIDLIVFNVILDDGLLIECQFIYRDIKDFYKFRGIITFVISRNI